MIIGWENWAQHSSRMDVKFLVFLSRSLHVSLTGVLLSPYLFCISSSCSIRVSLACWLKLWLGSLKCSSACGAFCLLTSLRWLFNLMLNSVSDFPMYWIRQILHSISYINSLLLQLRSWKVWYVFCVTLLLKDCLCKTCLQYKFPDFEKHLVENPIFFLLGEPL